ncbi:MAG: DNA primase [bacterium]|nr:DNA primase [bacterium]
MQNPIEEIKNRLDIVEVIGSYIKLQKAGANYRAVCPFHSEKKPSFFVSPARQIWHCFGGCSKGGNVFGFVMEIEGVEFGDALRILAQKAGVELKRQTKEYSEWKSERERLYEICELAARFFEKQLEESKVGGEAKKYLLERGIKEESLKKWRVGYAPDVWQGLSDFLTSRSYQKEEVEKAGLGLTSEKGSFYDRFRGRIIFPIFDINSQIIGFGGRVFKDKDKGEIAKYVNTPQTLLYDKSRTLYGLDKAKLAIRKQDACVLVEGYTDLIMVSQTGSENVVATSGTALTSFQLKILKRYSENLITAFDMDIAGDAATKRGIDLAQSQGFNVKVITLPDGFDPADFVLKFPEQWEEKIKSAKSILDFYFETTFSKFDRETSEGKREISKILLSVIKRIPSKIIQNHWTGEFAKRLRVKEEAIEEELKKIKTEDAVSFAELDSQKEKEFSPKCRKDLLEERLGILALKAPENVSLLFLKEPEPGMGFADLVSAAEVREILLNLKENPKFDFSRVPISSTVFFNSLSLGADIEEIEEKDLLPEMGKCWRGIQLLEIKDKLGKISECIRMAETEKNLEKIEKFIKEFNSYSKTICDLEEI